MTNKVPFQGCKMSQPLFGEHTGFLKTGKFSQNLNPEGVEKVSPDPGPFASSWSDHEEDSSSA